MEIEQRLVKGIHAETGEPVLIDTETQQVYRLLPGDEDRGERWIPTACPGCRKVPCVCKGLGIL
jgi:hypothetical protein